MEIQTFLAMTAAEICQCPAISKKIGWMACHFSSSGPGLSNVPQNLPSGSLLILDDSTPLYGHDPQIIATQLRSCLENLDCQSLLLDFQQPKTEDAVLLVRHLIQSLPCPVAVSAGFAAEQDCPVFLPPLPHHVPLAAHIAPWQGRELWLELALDSEIITLTESGCTVTPLPSGELFVGGHPEKALHCHYRIELSDNAAKFTLWRTAEDLRELLAEAENLGISTAVGLYQELSCRGWS